MSTALDLRLREVTSKLEQNGCKQKERDEYLIQEQMKMCQRLDTVEAKVSTDLAGAIKVNKFGKPSA
eukprot:12903603-Heterocapsa_arctica.AAC.1